MKSLMRHLPLLFAGLTGLVRLDAADPYPDRFVWVFGWNLNRDADVQAIRPILETAGEHGLNGAVLSAGLDTLCKKPPEYFRRLEEVRQACAENGLELIPSLFSVGYGGAALAHNPHLAAGVPVIDAPFVVSQGRAQLLSGGSAALANGGFEEHEGDRLRRFSFHDQPGTVSFVDTQVVHSGNAALRLEQFTANPHGHGRVMQEVAVIPHRCYRVRVWARTEDLRPARGFQLLALAGDRNIAPRTFDLPPTTEWRPLTMIFNSLEFSRVRLYAGIWGGRQGKLWLDDWQIEELGPVNVLHRPGTPVRVSNDDGSVLYAQDRDYAALVDPAFRLYQPDHEAATLRILPDGRIREGQRLRVSWYHPMIIHDSQITLCMAEPELYEIWDHEAALLAKHLKPRRVLLNMDEIRMGGTCQACAGRDMARLLGDCITRQTEILKRHLPGVTLYIWSDMLDPNHNAHGDYYLVKGDFTGSWNHVPRDLVMAVWGGEPREKSLRFFEDQGFATLVACYYDADDLQDVRGWMKAAEPITGVRGFMYTPWQRKYNLLADFGHLIQDRNP